MLGGLGWQELVIVLIIVIIIFGAGRLPEIGGAVGKSIKEFRTQAQEDDEKQISSTTTATTDAPVGTTTTTTTYEPSRPAGQREVRADEI
jgi:sec-independent protein translocase protein TatA